jgi:hypothetical protein
VCPAAAEFSARGRAATEPSPLAGGVSWGMLTEEGASAASSAAAPAPPPPPPPALLPAPLPAAARSPLPRSPEPRSLLQRLAVRQAYLSGGGGKGSGAEAGGGGGGDGGGAAPSPALAAAAEGGAIMDEDCGFSLRVDAALAGAGLLGSAAPPVAFAGGGDEDLEEGAAGGLLRSGQSPKPKFFR